jgi:decaprenyl-phosphate phosphoribosyltransferase
MVALVIYDLFLLMRPRQWTKNLFIFLPLFFSLQVHNLHLLARAGSAFVIFCCLASAVYIFNDYHDREEDRGHPGKKSRPLAAGRVTPRSALSSGVLLAAAGLLGAGYLDISLFYLTLLYLALNISYTVKLKHFPLIDILIIALGFVIRITVGGVVTGLTLYPWIIVMTFLLALFLAVGKRRDDVLLFMNSGERVRKSINGYTVNFIDSIMVVLAAVTIVSYIMYTMSSEITAKFKTGHLYLTTIFVILGIMRYLQIIIVERCSADPVEILWKDSFIQIAIIGWITTFGLLIYLR